MSFFFFFVFFVFFFFLNTFIGGLKGIFGGYE